LLYAGGRVERVMNDGRYSIIARSAVKNFKNSVLNQTAGNYTKSYETWKRIYNVVFSFQKEVLKSPKQELDVLDLGCGDGYHLFLMAADPLFCRKKIRFSGVDLQRADIIMAEEVREELKLENVDFTQCDFKEFKFDDKKYDIVICTDVVEHLLDTEKILKDIFNILKPGGLAIITTPNDDNYIVRLAEILKAGKHKEN
jgi:2-polyprenyl-3-methyl-5-hydroxy-6-metoxy-1,4-benzoquinol methylase